MIDPKISVKINRNDFNRLAARAPRDAEDVVEALAREGERYVKQIIRDSPASGRSYMRGAATHVASAPGNPPRIDTGALINSINVYRPGARKRIIATGVEYAMGLEFGTERIAARPYMGPMAYWLEGEVTAIVRAVFGAI